MDWRVEVHDALRSTQDAVKARAEAGEGAGLVVQALAQSAGRGRLGRVWTSPPGNLYVSVLLRPRALPAGRVGELSLVAGAALARALPGTRLKWPNDVLMRGRKCAGVLVETGLEGDCVAWATLGIGVNVAAPPPGAGAAPDATLGAVLDALGQVYALWQEQGLDPIRAAWMTYSAYALGDAVTAAGRTGAFGGLDTDGTLLLDGRRVTMAD